MGSLLARAYKRILSGKLAQDAGEHWVTVNAGSKEGGEGGGSHVLLDGEGRVIAGMGGKFKGQNIDRIERKKFINQNAWNRQRKALTEKAGEQDGNKMLSAGIINQMLDPENAFKSHIATGKKNLAEVLKRSKADTTGMGLINKLHTGIETEQAEKQAREEPKADRKSLIDQVNARHTMPMGDIIARKEQAITDKINNSNLSEEDKKNYLDKLNSLTDEALKAGAGSLDLYKVGVSYKKTNAESNAFNKMYVEQGKIDDLEKDLDFAIFTKHRQEKKQGILSGIEEANKEGAIYFKDPSGKEYYRTNANSKTWNSVNESNREKADKAREKQEALNYEKKANSSGLGTFKFDGGKITISEVQKNGSTETQLKVDRGMLPTDVKQLLQSKGFNVNPVKRTWWHIGSMLDGSRKDILKALNAQAVAPKGETPKSEEQPRGMKNAFSDKYQKIDNSNLNKYQKVDNISNNKNTEKGVTNMNTIQESQAKTYEGNKLASYYNQHGVKALENANEQEHVKVNGEVYVKQADGSWTNPETKATASTNQIADKLNTVISKSLEEQYSSNPFNLHALRGCSMQISPSAHKGEQSAVVKFYNQPEQSTIDMLKQNGFKWMQSKKSWVHNGEIGNKSHLDVLKALKGVAPAPQPSQATPTAQQPAQPSKAKTETKSTKPANTNMSVKAYEGKANINPRVATYLEDMGMKLSKAQYDKIATDYPAGDRSGSASALVGRDMRALQAFKKDYAKEISNTIADQEAAFEDVGGYHDFKGGSITISKKGYSGDAQHASISFAGKPSEETRSLLKKNGFTYNPRYKTWENTERLGSKKHEKVLQALRDGVTIESTQQATPTAQPSQATPTQQAEGKQYHGTGIENKNGRYEVSFNAFPSYELRTDMKNNGFRWDPNAKVWHTTDREKLDKVMSKHFTERT